MSYDYDSVYYAIRIIFNLVWLVVGIVMGRKAKEQGLSFWLYFIVVWLLGIIGLVIALVQIDRHKKINQSMMYQQQQFYNQNNQYGQYNQYGQNPYAQNNPYDQNNQYNQYNAQGANPYAQQNYNQQYANVNQANEGTSFHTCPNCGNSQKSGGFCQICGSKID